MAEKLWVAGFEELGFEILLCMLLMVCLVEAKDGRKGVKRILKICGDFYSILI